MTETIITIPGKPIPLKRPRLGKKKVYDSQAQLKYAISWMIKAQLTQQPLPFTGPVTLDFEFHMPIPKMSKKKKDQTIGQPHIKRPDLDNCIKFYCDVCTVLLYKDDSQVYNISATKTYSEEPKTVIKVHWEHDEENH